MELKGFKRQQRNLAVAAAAAGVFAAGIGISAPIAAAAPTAGETWTMGSYRGEVLQRAIDDVIANAGEQNVRFNLYDRVLNQVIYNYTNWVVCGQSPRADASVKVGEKPQTVTFALSRRSTGC
ncbi:hypothetical protein [Mycolicibacterium vanbaalenii]|uniref:PASTA domain-containing protein n=1 Tax=Mycolicibacterium vanbaalenii (strain DSM 7251 / JCM 13017 / BCRC 16820 / KCTC 9966 / NRRL B-24157 / PYR-1) TaxID=350058 RepID=A1T5Q1_MYCVP|nr:hypothetical protein [Mycolicibacterium vanbaalenii]ABM12501.1 conserved hypothetical protein [Mycolicibacterium vanbaalenii PYR-1]MCV7129765.1 hypothetical protein [Mycolicibacterium vanbaalenii PYR-1]